MPVAMKLPPASEPRAILKPAGNRVTVSEEPKHKKDNVKTPLVQSNVSLDSTCSSDSCSSNSSTKKVKSATASRRSAKRNGFKPVRVVPDAVDVATVSPPPKTAAPPKRCEWITPNSDPLYTAFHDEEWGVPVGDDRKLFELLVFSQALAEHSWPAILNQRDIFRHVYL
ncbi:DNA-3-methyladenine glycosylase 1 [Spatholobus suberectus]|nr:DNA-3-methyladenine glycosylase 1 [Spatholobus suberectus]